MDSLEKSVGELLISKHLTVTCAESCTGGLVSARLINVPGISASYRVGFVTYADEAKHSILGVKSETLDKFSAVSKETALEMVQGARMAANADAAVATTGYAGPESPENNSLVGLVFIACAVNDLVTVEECHFKGNREEIREEATKEALILLRKCLNE